MLELNHRWHNCQRSQRCHQKLQRFPKSNFVRNIWKTISLFISKFLAMQDWKSFWKIPLNVGTFLLTPPPTFFQLLEVVSNEKFLTMLDFYPEELKSFWKIPHNVGFIQVKIQHCEEFSSSLNWIIICINVKDLKGVITSLKKIIISIFFISKFPTMQDSKCFSKNSSQFWI